MPPAAVTVEERLRERLAGRGEARFDVVGLGEISVDDVLLVDEPLDGILRGGGKARVRRRERLGGGQVATAMVAARRLGLRAALVGAVGADEPGRRALAELRDEGVDVRGVRVLGGATHAAAIVVDGEGERAVLCHDDPRVALAAEELLPEDVAGGRVLHVDGSFLAASITAARIARAAGCLVSCDLERVEANTGDLLALVDVCVVPAAFPAAWSGDLGASRERNLALLAAQTASGLAIVTLGGTGAAAWDGERCVHEPAFAVSPWVDSTACGDT